MHKLLTDPSDWDELLEYIADKQVTPIVGGELYQFRKDGLLTSFDDHLSQQLLQNSGAADQGSLPLTKAVSYLLTEKRLKTLDVNRRLKNLVKDVSFDFPLLRTLLSITDLPYVVNTTVYDNVLEKTLRDVRHQEPTSINFSLNEPFSDCDDLEKLKQPFVFNVFGSLLHTVDAAVSEEDMLEYTGYFKEKMKGAANIVNALRNHHLLFIGCAFPDWMVRFVLRLLTNEPLQEWGSRRSIIVVNDRSNLREAQFDYLRKFDVVTYEGNTADFIEELSKRWQATNRMQPKHKKIFLSYTVRDRAAVEAMKAALENIEHVNCWYDNHELGPGDDFKTEIAKSIRSADLFIPLLSANSLQHKDGYVQLEWLTADNVATFRKLDGQDGKYLMPVVIDETNPYDAGVPRYFSALSIGRVPQGQPDTTFLEQVREALFVA